MFGLNTEHNVVPDAALYAQVSSIKNLWQVLA